MEPSNQSQNSMNFDQTESLRYELVSFLEESRRKVDAYGKPLLSYPKNFEKVTEVMDRKDIFNTDPNCWSTSMLNDQFDEDVKSSFEGGRYRHVFDDSVVEMKVSKGLAEICMLDRQLEVLNKRANKINAENAEFNKKSLRRHREDRTSDVPDDTFLTRARMGSASSRGSATSSTPGTARSGASVFSGGAEDEAAAVVGEEGEGEGVGSDEEEEQQEEQEEEAMEVQSPASQSRQGPSPRVLRGSAATLLATSANTDSAHGDRNINSGQPRPVRRRGGGGGVQGGRGVGLENKDFIKENKTAVKSKGGNRLSRAQQERVQELLLIIPDPPEPAASEAKGSASADTAGASVETSQSRLFGDAWKEFTRFAVSEQQEKRLRDIDRQLETFMAERSLLPPSLSGSASCFHASPAGPVAVGQDPSSSSVYGPKEVPADSTASATAARPERTNYLLQQRVERSRRAYSSALDRALQLQATRRPPVGAAPDDGVLEEADEEWSDELDEGGLYVGGDVDEEEVRSASREKPSHSRSMRSVVSRPVSALEIKSMLDVIKSSGADAGLMVAREDPSMRAALDQQLQSLRRDMLLERRQTVSSNESSRSSTPSNQTSRRKTSINTARSVDGVVNMKVRERGGAASVGSGTEEAIGQSVGGPSKEYEQMLASFYEDIDALGDFDPDGPGGRDVDTARSVLYVGSRGVDSRSYRIPAPQERLYKDSKAYSEGLEESEVAPPIPFATPVGAPVSTLLSSSASARSLSSEVCKDSDRIDEMRLRLNGLLLRAELAADDRNGSLSDQDNDIEDQNISEGGAYLREANDGVLEVERVYTEEPGLSDRVEKPRRIRI